MDVAGSSRQVAGWSKEMAMLRLDKYLSEMGIGTRSEVKQMIKKGKVTINGLVAKKPEEKVNPEADQVCLDGKSVAYVEYEYLMFHKPKGCVSATQDNHDRTVLDYIDGEDVGKKKELFPVGRLDKDTEGLLLLTNDGELAHQLLSPRKHVEKRYFTRLANEVGEEEVKWFEQGLDIGDEKMTLPAKLELTQDPKEAYVVITEGRFHQVKRMFQACDNEVVYLKRISMGTLVLDEQLKPGEYRRLSRQELDDLQNR